MAISAWSASRADVFTQCPKRAEYAYIHKIQEPDRGPPPKNLKEWPNDRGSRIHDYCEFYVRGKHGDQLAEMGAFEDEFYTLRSLYEKRCVFMEEMWCFDRDWNPVPADDYPNIWLRVKVDALVTHPDDPTRATVIDYKTGKRIYNEIKHGKQMQLYQLATLLRFPDLEQITVELWYLDQNELATQTFSRSQGMKFFKGFDTKGKQITSTIEFEPKPSKHACNFCPFKSGLIGRYGPEGTGHCDKNPI